MSTPAPTLSLLDLPPLATFGLGGFAALIERLLDRMEARE